MRHLHNAFGLLATCGVLALLIGCGEQPSDADGPGPTGSVHLVVSTTGKTLDQDGYQLVVDGTPLAAVALHADTSFDAVPSGDRTVTLGGVAPNCRTTPAGAQHLTVPEGGPLTATFAVTCDSAWRDLLVVRRIEVDTTGCPSVARVLSGRIGAATLCSSHFSLIRMRPDGSGQTLLVDNANRASMNAAGTLMLVDFFGTFGLYHVGTGTLDMLPPSGHYEQFGALAPDGKRFAFTTDKSGEWQTYVRDIGGGNEKRVTTSDRQETAPAWSPDGSRLVIGRSTADYRETWVVTLAAGGGSEHTLVGADEDGAGAYGYSLDGQRILYNSFVAGTNDVWSMDPDGTHRTNHTGSDRLGFHNSGLFSPDRAQVMYDRGGDGLFVVDTAGGPPVQITFPEGLVFETPMVWLP